MIQTVREKKREQTMRDEQCADRAMQNIFQNKGQRQQDRAKCKEQTKKVRLICLDSSTQSIIYSLSLSLSNQLSLVPFLRDVHVYVLPHLVYFLPSLHVFVDFLFVTIIIHNVFHIHLYNHDIIDNDTNEDANRKRRRRRRRRRRDKNSNSDKQVVGKTRHHMCGQLNKR